MGLFSGLFSNKSQDSIRRIPAPEVRPFDLEVKTQLSERYTQKSVDWDGVIYWLSVGDQELVDKAVDLARWVASQAANSRHEAKNAFKMNVAYIKTPLSMADVNSLETRTRSITVSTNAYTSKGNKRKYPLEIIVPCTIEAKTRRRSGGTASYSKGTIVNMFFDWDGLIGKAEVIGVPDFRTRWIAKFKIVAGQLALYRMDREKILEDDFNIKKDSWDF